MQYNKLPKISVITVNYNNSIGLEKTIKSLKKQTYTNIEYIVIDGGSVDRSIDIIREYIQCIQYFISEPDKGIYDAMNKGVHASSGNYLYFLNSGDVFVDDSILERVALHLNEDVIYGDIYKIDEKGNKTLVGYPDELKFSYLFEDVISHQAMFISKKIFEKVGLYDLKYTLAADWIHFIKTIVQHGFKYKHIHEPVCLFDTNGISSQSEAWHTIISEKHDFFRKEFRFYYDDYLELLQYHSSHRISYVMEIERVAIIRKLATILLYPIYKIAKVVR